MRFPILLNGTFIFLASTALAAEGAGTPPPPAGASPATAPGGAPTPSTESATSSPPAYSATVPPPVRAAAAPDLTGPSVLGILAYNSGYGLGARYALPLGIGSILNNPTVRDGFAAEFAADYVHWSRSSGLYNWSYQVFRLAGGVMWNVWVSDSVTLYPKLELGYNHWSYKYNGYSYNLSYSPIFFNGALGAMYKSSSGLVARAEIGYSGLALGAGWFF